MAPRRITAKRREPLNFNEFRGFLFASTVQNKLHYAVQEHTAAEVIYNRVDNEKPFVGMTNFTGNYMTTDDVKIATNYLSEV